MTLPRDQLEELARITDPSTGFEHFLEHHVYIEDQRYGVVKFEMWPGHRRMAQELTRHRLIVLLKARQIGMSWSLGAAYPLWLCMFQPNKKALLFSRGEDEAGELIAKIRFVHARLPEWMRVPITKNNALEIEFASMESGIQAFSSAKHSGTSYSASLVMSDEYAKQEYAEAQFAAIRPTIDMGGQFLAVSTANGPGTFHARLWHEARKGLNGFTPLFFGYDTRPERTPEWWERTKLTYPLEWQFHSEYPRNPEEAIQSSAPAVFPRVEALAPDQPLDRDRLSKLGGEDWGLLSKIRPRRGEAGLRVYQLPVKGRSYAIGADVAEGEVKGDAQAAVVLDRDSYEEVACLHGHWAVPDYARLLVALSTVYNGALLAPEANNHGNGLILEVKREQIERARQKRACKLELYHRKPLLDAQGKVSRPGKPGFLTSKATKPVIVGDLRDAILNEEVRLASPALLEELALFQQNEDESYSAPSGYHDDLVMALAIAWQMCLKPRAGPRPVARPYAIGPGAKSLGDTVEFRQGSTPLDKLLERMRASRERRGQARRPTYLRRRPLERLAW